MDTVFADDRIFFHSNHRFFIRSDVRMDDLAQTGMPGSTINNVGAVAAARHGFVVYLSRDFCGCLRVKNCKLANIHSKNSVSQLHNLC